MSDEIFSVATTYPDVASLAQGYMNRADGERLLLPLPNATRQGAGVRFVVYLNDGTPAFAGAGLCSQVSDQGNTVPAEQRFETLLDTLQFDDRSRPVYEYIVAVRSAAYAQQRGSQPDLEDAHAEAVIDEPEVEAGGAGEYAAEAGEDAAEADVPVDAGEYDAEATVDDADVTHAASEPAEAWAMPAPSQAPAELEPMASDPPAAFAAQAPVYASVAPLLTHEMPSFIPPPLPTGLLTRPARTTHWQPSPPRRPTPRPATGLFRYTSGGLPRPARPPYPDLDRAAWVEPAPRPEA